MFKCFSDPWWGIYLLTNMGTSKLWHVCTIYQQDITKLLFYKRVVNSITLNWHFHYVNISIWYLIKNIFSFEIVNPTRYGGGVESTPPRTYLYIASEPLGWVSSYLVTFIYMFLQSNVQSFGSLGPFMKKLWGFEKN